MSDRLRQRHERLRVDALLERHDGLRIVPSRSRDLVIAGPLHFRVRGPDHEEIEDEYEVELRVPPGFPSALPTARELGGRIPGTHHKLVGDLLCLGAPTEMRWKLGLTPTLPAFVDGFVIPYLYGYSFFVKYGRMPFGELAHGDEGIRGCLAEMFGARRIDRAEEFLRLASMKKRDANKQLCPCCSGIRLGKCHNRPVNCLRKRLGRGWFRNEYTRVLQSLDGPHPNRKEC
jgi:hypothetical protein